MGTIVAPALWLENEFKNMNIIHTYLQAYRNIWYFFISFVLQNADKLKINFVLRAFDTIW